MVSPTVPKRKIRVCGLEQFLVGSHRSCLRVCLRFELGVVIPSSRRLSTLALIKQCAKNRACRQCSWEVSFPAWADIHTLALLELSFKNAVARSSLLESSPM